MATLTKTVGPVAYPTIAKEFLWTASTPAGDEVVLTGNDILLIWNSDVGVGYDYTIHGVPDSYGRDATITTELAAGEFAIFGPIPLSGWANTNGKLDLASENAAIKWAVITLHD